MHVCMYLRRSVWLYVCVYACVYVYSASSLIMSFKRARAELGAGGAFTLPQNPEAEDFEELQKAAKNFRSFLVDKYASGSISASDTCVLAYLHVEAGGQGAEDLALHPSQASKHASDHLRCQGWHNDFCYDAFIK